MISVALLLLGIRPSTQYAEKVAIRVASVYNKTMSKRPYLAKVGRPTNLERNIKICELTAEGWSLTRLADTFNLNKSSISRIIQKYWGEYLKEIRKNKQR